MFHTAEVKSEDPVMICSPSCMTYTEKTDAVCPWKVFKHSPVSVFHILALLSPEPEKRNLSSLKRKNQSRGKETFITVVSRDVRENFPFSATQLLFRGYLLLSAKDYDLVAWFCELESTIDFGVRIFEKKKKKNCKFTVQKRFSVT